VGFELLLIMVIALVVLGPAKLPKLAADIGRWTGRARAMARQLRNQLDQEIQAEELLRSRTPPASPMTSAPQANAESVVHPATAPVSEHPPGTSAASTAATEKAPRGND
jgi:sec-independent protein translocase protein TatB